MYKIRTLCVAFTCFVIYAKSLAQTDYTWWYELVQWDGVTPWACYYTYSPRYFGPNAFPVPRMGDGKVNENLTVEAAFEQYWGFGDNATDLNVRIDIPLYPKYVNLSLWMVPVEYFSTSIHIRNERRMRIEDPKGWAFGDVYIQTGIQILRDRPKAPDIMINLTMKTASGSPLVAARYYDTPGYFFDATVGKTFTLGKESRQVELAVSGRAGFLCWQSARTNYEGHKLLMQDDAFLYGLRLGLSMRKWQFETDFSGYEGWIHIGDAPMVLRVNAGYHFPKGNTLFVGGLLGFRDYRYYMVNIGYRFSTKVRLYERSKKQPE